jgi:hypothetical protein
MSYHGTHVVVIEIPEDSWGAGGQTTDTEKISKFIGTTQGPKTPGRSTGERSQAKGYKGLVIGDTSRNGNLCTLRHAEAVSEYSAGSEASSTTLA